MLAVNLLLVVCTVISFVPMQATLQFLVACRTLSNEKLDGGPGNKAVELYLLLSIFYLLIPQEHVAGERRSCALPALAYYDTKSTNICTTAVSGVGKVRTLLLVCSAWSALLDLTHGNTTPSGVCLQFLSQVRLETIHGGHTKN